MENDSVRASEGYYYLVESEDSAQLQTDVVTEIWQPPQVELSNQAGAAVLEFSPVEPHLGPYPHPRFWGWRHIQDASGLLESFVRLKTDAEILSFAQTWGPLYLSPFIGNWGLWRPYPISLPRKDYWEPVEPLDRWHAHIGRAKATLKAVSMVRQHPPKPVPLDLWEELGVERDFDEEQPIEDRSILASQINSYFAGGFGGASLFLDPQTLGMKVDTGLGFIRMVFFLIAQAASRERAVYVCSGCGTPYARPLGTRAPRATQHNYCPQCADKQRVSKRLSIASKRQALRELVTFFGVETPPGSDPQMRLDEWNKTHPDSTYDSVERVLLDLQLTGSYGVSTEGVDVFLGRWEMHLAEESRRPGRSKRHKLSMKQ